MVDSVVPKGILVVDDEAGNLNLFKMILERKIPQAVVYTAPDGQAALDIMLKEVVPQHDDGQRVRAVIFTDVEMPGLNGPTFVRQVQDWEEGRLRDVPVILHSTSSDPMLLKHISNVLGHANFAFMAKPASPDKIMQVVTQALLRLDETA